MGIGTGAAILGSSVIGGLSSIFGANDANDAAAQNAALAQQNIEAANNAIYQSLDPAHQDRLMGADIMAGGLYGAGQNYMDQNRYISQYGPQALDRVRGLNPNINTPTAYGGNTQIGLSTNYSQDPNIASQWGALRDPSAFYESPDYQFRLKEGLDAVQNSAAAQGGLYSGNTLRDITNYASNLAGSEYGDYFQRQAALGDREYGREAGNFARGMDQFGQNYARAYGQAAGNIGRDYDVFQGDYQRGYGQAVDNYGRTMGQQGFLAGYGVPAYERGLQVQYGTDVGIPQAYADVYGQRAQDTISAGRGYAGNFTQNAAIQASTPYVSPWGGINQAVQGGLNNWALYRGANPKPQVQNPNTGYFPGMVM